MCTLIVASRAWSGVPLVVAANRDEQLERPSGPPRMWADRPVPLFAPVDEAGRGTWLGLNVHGLFVGITNRFGTTLPRENRRSRGLLVLDALEEADAQSAIRRVVAYGPSVHNRFHLLAADKKGAYLVVNDGKRIRELKLATGLHILTERSQVGETSKREELIAARMKPHLESGVPGDKELAQILSIHAEDPFDGTCVHAKAYNYGTRSSTLIWLYKDKDSVRFLHAEGPPCQTPYQDYSGQAATVLALG